MYEIDETHDASLTSWVGSARGHTDFPIQNLPFGLFRRQGTAESWRGGVAIGEEILDLALLHQSGLVTGTAATAIAAASQSTLNAYMALGRTYWVALRKALSRLLSAADPKAAAHASKLAPLLVRQSAAQMTVPAQIGDYSDFYTSLSHATNGGRIHRRNPPVPVSFKHLPIGYHGRASTIVVSGTPVRRPLVQSREDGRELPEFGPTRQLDYEAELAFYIGPGNQVGEPIRIAEIHDHLFGVSILNDWSARDAQRWESAVVGPLLGKDFATSVSPWIVTMDALAPFLVEPFQRSADDPEPLPYLKSEFEAKSGGIDIVIEVAIQSASMRNQNISPYRLSQANFRNQYFTIGQMAAHHVSNGCRLRPGDLVGSGTISDVAPGSWGCLVEITSRGEQPVSLPDGESRRFLEDGDEVIMRANCSRPGYLSIGFGECRGRILCASAHALAVSSEALAPKV